MRCATRIGATISADGSTVAWMGATVYKQARMLPQESEPRYTEPLWRHVVVANAGDDFEHLGLHAPCPKQTGQTGRLKGSQNPALSQRELSPLRAY